MQPTGQRSSKVLLILMLSFVVLAIVGFLVLGPVTGKTGSLNPSKHTALPASKH